MIIDTDTSCLGKSQTLKDMNVDTVGRYYSKAGPGKVIKKAEAQELSKKGIRIFTVYEDFGSASKLKLTQDQGGKDGSTALSQAQDIGQPEGSAIYFAVEGLPSGYTSADIPAIKDYFSGVTAAIGGKYALGVYGDGIVCQTLLNQNIVKFTWLAAASTSFAGTKAFTKSWRWSLAQLGPLDISVNGLSVDIDAANGEFGAFTVPTL